MSTPPFPPSPSLNAKQLTGPGQLGEGSDGSHALIYSSLVLHHVKDCQGEVSAVAGYLRPGGRLLLFDFEATENAALSHPSDFEVQHIGGGGAI